MTTRPGPLVLPLLVALLLPAAARAQTRAPRPKPRAAATAPAEPAAAVPAADPGPAPAAAVAPAPRAAPRTAEVADDGSTAPQGPPATWFEQDEWRVTPLLGFEAGVGDASYTAAKIRLDLETTVAPVSPRAVASFLLSVGALHASGEESIVLPVAYPGLPPESVSVKWAANVFDLVPTGRVRFAPSPKVWFHADGGLGVAYTVATGEVTLPAPLGKITPVADGLAGVVRLGGGLTFAPDPNLRIGATIGLDLRFGDGTGSAFSLLASASHRF